MRKRTGDVMLRKREKFGRKAVAVDCVVVNGDFETGSLPPWRFDPCCVTVEEEGGNYYACVQT